MGYVMERTIESMKPYVAFVNLGNNLTGYAHISEISLGHIKTPKEALEVGQTDKAKVIKNENGKISLSLRNLLEEQLF